MMATPVVKLWRVSVPAVHCMRRGLSPEVTLLSLWPVPGRLREAIR